MYQQSSQYPSMSPAMIGSGPSYQQQAQRVGAVNNVIIPIGGDDDYKGQRLAKKPTYLPNGGIPQDDRIAGVKFRPKSGERSMNEIFS